ncbi:Ammonia channel [Candidatus Magnetaquicoccaceae bacterium FCR-1]|uniref:Ammonium transporter n=1 Tax=Candidatus Magnetaquiglobus chichijimensis TaxID=3141448 RepID=A0ABQ0C8I8_9PROT
MKRLSLYGLMATLPTTLLLPSLALAEEAAAAVVEAPPPVLSSGDTAWMLTSTALVLFMTLPGLALFYGGMVRAKNTLSIFMQCFAITAVVTVLWSLYGYSLAFTDGGNNNAWIGGLSKAFLAGIKVDSLTNTIPESVFLTFQLTFAIITPALIVGAFAERMKFSSMLIFMAAWVTLVYFPICHWVWGGGWMMTKGILDYAGGTVVHVNAGIAGLVTALVLGKRKGFPHVAMPPHSLPLTVTGAGMLWVGWFGFNAGSAAAANGAAGMAMVVTQLATAMAALTWMLMEWMSHGKPSALGLTTGAVAGLVAITPASGFVGPMGALALGGIAGVVCFIGATTIKRKMGYDDSLDAFGVHGIGGIVGAILTGVFASADLGGVGYAKDVDMAAQVWVQFVSVIATGLYCAVISYILLKIIDGLMGLRVDEESESTGLDIALHGERGYNY